MGDGHTDEAAPARWSPGRDPEWGETRRLPGPDKETVRVGPEQDQHLKTLLGWGNIRVYFGPQRGW